MTEAFDSGSSTSQNLTDSGTGSAGFSTGGDPSAGSPVNQSQPVGGDNPAWQPFLNDLPDFFHEKAKGHFRKWDDNYRAKEAELKSLQEQYEPYKPYVGVDPGAIQYGLGLLNQIQNNPMAVYNALLEHVKQQGLLQDDTLDNSQDQSLENTDPRYAEIERRQKEIDDRQAAFEQTLQEQAYNQQVAGFEEQINKDVQAIVQKYGAQAVDPMDLLQRMLVQTYQGGNFDAEKAYEEQRATFQRMYANVNGNRRPAPNVLAPGGQPPPNGVQKSPKDMNEQERAAYFKQLLDAHNAGG